MADHHYMSTACLHALWDNRPELHNYCAGKTRIDGGKKRPAQCKWCAAGCVCNCHDKETTT